MERKILIVEDEPKVAGFIRSGLSESSLASDWAADGESGIAMLEANNYDLLILDLNLPRKNGFEVCAAVRKNDRRIPVLMLTAWGAIDDKLKGFESGADDYLVKPFEFQELLARVKALLKRTEPELSEPSTLRYADITLNLDTREVHRAGNKISLTPKEYGLLEYLLRNPERVVTRAEIASHVWSIQYETGTNFVDVYINFLRKKIDRGYIRKLIHTHVGSGYILRQPNP